MDRRNFLRRAGGMGGAAVLVGATAAATAVADQAAEDFTHNGYRVKWRGWISPSNQNIVYGMWIAKHESQDLEWVSTTLGQCYPTRDWEALDLTCAPNWPRLTIFSTDADRATVKARARKALLEAL